MRVISGKWKGRLLKAPSGMKTRPTSDKVKEAMFHRIGPYFDGGSGLDLYAGSGNLGIEALSRGFSSFIFVDKNRSACHAIRSNLKTLEALSVCEVYQMDVERAILRLFRQKQSFDLICMDPPYDDSNIEQVLKKLAQHQLLKKDGLIYCEHRSTYQAPRYISSLHCQQTYEYGDTSVSLFVNEL